ncbi:MAG TPA: nucleotide exchange factor GrpE [Thermoanaerobaculia bacterium]|nr:nucleotide exchange factor GrpE [Thermoanaerobaculia bacterium]
MGDPGIIASATCGDDAALASPASDTRLDAVLRELGLLRKTVLRQGHAQELFQARVDEAVGRLTAVPESARPSAPAAGSVPSSAPTSAQLRVLLELDQAVCQLLRLAEGAPDPNDPNEALPEDTPRSLREGLGLLQVRVRNLQHSMGLAAIPARDLPFDDRWHEACGVTHRPDLPDGQVVEEILPGYRLGERVVRPARVVVNVHTSSRPEEGA